MSGSPAVSDEGVVQAAVSPELRREVQSLVNGGGFSTEADVVRAALVYYVEFRRGGLSAPTGERNGGLTSEQHRDLKQRLDLIAWMLSAIMLLISTVSGRLLRQSGDLAADPLDMVDQALRLSVQERPAMRLRLGAQWRAFRRARTPESLSGD